MCVWDSLIMRGAVVMENNYNIIIHGVQEMHDQVHSN